MSPTGGGVTVDDDEVRAATEADRLTVADLLAGLDPPEWTQPSLCAGWTVHDVAAHLTLGTRMSMTGALVGMIRARGDLNRLTDDATRRRGRQYQAQELVAMLREDAGSRKRPPGTTLRDPFVDILVHGLDIARPLGRDVPRPVDRTVAGLDHLWSGSLLGAGKRFAGLRFVATDTGWAAGEGTDEVTGPAADLLLLSAGRPAGLDGVTGPGVPEARRRVGG